MAIGAPRASSWLGVLRAAARAGIEPAIDRLTAGCLATWLPCNANADRDRHDGRGRRTPAGEEAPRGRAARWFPGPVEISKNSDEGRRGSGSRNRTCIRGFKARRPAVGRSRRDRFFRGGFPGNRTLPCRLRAGCPALEPGTRAEVGPEGFAPPSHRLRVECLAVGPRTLRGHRLRETLSFMARSSFGAG